MAYNSLEKQHENQKYRKEIVENKVKQKKLEFELKRLEKFSYEVLKSNKKRKQPSFHRQEENVNLSEIERLKAITLCRELLQNSTIAATMHRSMLQNIVGTGAKVKFHFDDRKTSKKWEDHFNKRFAKKADFRRNFNFNEIQKLVLSALLTDGDILIYWREDSIQIFEANQIKNASDLELKDGFIQKDGLILDEDGRVVSYVVTQNKSAQEVKKKEATILAAEDCTLVANKNHYSNYRGTPLLLTLAANIQDIKEILEAELASAKAASNFAVAITKEDASEVGFSRTTEGEDGELDEDEEIGIPNWERMFGPKMAYLEKGEGIEVVENKRPNAQINDFAKINITQAGGSIGLPSHLAQNKTENSFSAARQELNQAINNFLVWQKKLEREFLDFVVIKEFTKRIKDGDFNNEEDWDIKFSFIHVKQKSIDEQKEVNTLAKKLAMGRTTLAQEDPNWRENLEQMAEEKNFSENLGLRLPHFYEQFKLFEVDQNEEDEGNEEEGEEEGGEEGE